MSVFKAYKFQELAKLEQHLNGAIRAGRDPRKGYYGLVGTTLVFSKPSPATVTFVPGSSTPNDPYFLSFEDVKTQIEAALAAVKVYCDGPELVLIEAAPSSGVQITSGTALPLLGFDQSGVLGRVYNYPDGSSAATSPHWVSTFPIGNHYVLLVKE